MEILVLLLFLGIRFLDHLLEKEEQSRIKFMKRLPEVLDLFDSNYFYQGPKLCLLTLLGNFIWKSGVSGRACP